MRENEKFFTLKLKPMDFAIENIESIKKCYRLENQHYVLKENLKITN